MWKAPKSKEIAATYEITNEQMEHVKVGRATWIFVRASNHAHGTFLRVTHGKESRRVELFSGRRGGHGCVRLALVK